MPDPRMAALLGIDQKPPIDTSQPILEPGGAPAAPAPYNATPNQVVGQPDTSPQPEPPQAPAPQQQSQGPSLQELQATQQWALQNREEAHQRADRLRSTMASLGRDPMSVDEGKILDGLNGPLKDLIQRQAFVGEQQKQAHMQAETGYLGEETRGKVQDTLKKHQDMTPGSNANVARYTQAASLGKMFGLPPPNIDTFTADQEPGYLK